MNNKKSKDVLRSLCAFSNLVKFSKIRFLKPSCAPGSLRQDIGAGSFCSGKLLWRIDECVLLPCFNVQPDIFAVTV